MFIPHQGVTSRPKVMPTWEYVYNKRWYDEPTNWIKALRSLDLEEGEPGKDVQHHQAQSSYTKTGLLCTFSVSATIGQFVGLRQSLHQF